MLPYALAFAGFCALIVLHELGHFAAAKAVGMKVERFALFFPPLLFKVRRGETEYGIGAIPLGGYVRIAGMTPHEELSEQDAERAYYKQAVWKRIVVIAAGPAVNIVLAFLIIAAVYNFKGQADVRATATVKAINAGSPAARVLREGDVIVSADGVKGSTERLRAQINTHRCERQADGCTAQSAVALVVRRGDRTVELAARPRYDAEAGRMLLGFAYGGERVYRDMGPSDAVRETFSSIRRVTTLTLDRIGRLFFDEQARKELSGVVGSYEVTRQSFEFDTAQALLVLGLISLSLGIINLFPFLPLDGGHIFWALAEKIRGRPIPFEVLERVSVVGFVLVAFLFVVGLTNDIGRLSGEGFGVQP